jgi:hypothetical protein
MSTLLRIPLLLALTLATSLVAGCGEGSLEGGEPSDEGPAIRVTASNHYQLCIPGTQVCIDFSVPTLEDIEAELEQWLQTHHPDLYEEAGVTYNLMLKCVRYYALTQPRPRDVFGRPDEAGFAFAALRTCAGGAHDLYTSLDYDWKTGIAFNTEFTRLLKGTTPDAKSTADYLAAVSAVYADICAPNASGKRTKLSLWDVTRSTFNSDDRALQTIAVLFQDTSVRLEAPISDLRPALSGPTFESYLKVLSCFQGLSPENRTAVFAPPALSAYVRDLTPSGWYHLYVIAYAGKKMASRGVGAQTSFAFPFLLNLMYEFAKLNTMVDGQNPLYQRIAVEPVIPPDYEAIADPSVVEQVQVHLDNIYAGYLGAHWGSGSKTTTLSRKAIFDAFADGKPLAPFFAGITFEK